MNALTSFVQDVRYGARLLWRTPFFTAVAVASIAGGMTAAIGIFAVTNAIVSRPLTGFTSDVQRIFTSSGRGSPFGSNSFADVQDFTRGGTFAATCAVGRVSANVAFRTESIPRDGALVSEGCFQLLELRPTLGRLGLRNGQPEVVISHALWQRAFGGDASAVGNYVQLNVSGRDWRRASRFSRHEPGLRRQLLGPRQRVPSVDVGRIRRSPQPHVLGVRATA